MVKIEYKFESEEDFNDYLKLLIEKLDKYLIRYRMYIRELNSICLNIAKQIDDSIEKVNSEVLFKLIESPDYSNLRQKVTNITYKKYIFLSDAVNYIQLKILNIIGDRTKEAASYLKFRDSIKKYNEKNKDGIILDELNQGINEILKRCYNSRNFLAHTGDSVFISMKEYRNNQLKQYSKELGIDFVSLEKKANSLILVNTYNYVDHEWIFQMFIVMERAYSDFISIHQQMRRDFIKINKVNADIIKFNNTKLPIDYADISKSSADMQFKK